MPVPDDLVAAHRHGEHMHYLARIGAALEVIAHELALANVHESNREAMRDGVREDTWLRLEDAQGLMTDSALDAGERAASAIGQPER